MATPTNGNGNLVDEFEEAFQVNSLMFTKNNLFFITFYSFIHINESINNLYLYFCIS